MRARPRCLVVVTSSNQLYSGTGTALFDWIRFAKDRIEFEVTIDVRESRNASIAAEFCRTHSLCFWPSADNPQVGCPDNGVTEASRLLATNNYDVVECVSWANASTNLDVLESIHDGAVLIYTPHTQPLWTVGSPEHFFMVPRVFARMFERADLVFIDSSTELDDTELPRYARDGAICLPLGVDTEVFRFTDRPVGRKNVLSVCDFREPRKRADLLMRSIVHVAAVNHAVTFVLAGSRSTEVRLPADIAPRFSRLGYVGRQELVHEYQNAGVFVLLSDYEAFGLPIAEALCCGTPVVIHRQSQLEALFGDLPGVWLVQNDDTPSVAAAILAALENRVSRSMIAEAAVDRFAATTVYAEKLSHIMHALG